MAIPSVCGDILESRLGRRLYRPGAAAMGAADGGDMNHANPPLLSTHRES